VTTIIGINGYKKRKNFGNITVQKWECGIEFLREREIEKRKKIKLRGRKEGRREENIKALIINVNFLDVSF